MNLPELPKRPLFGNLQRVPNVDARFGSAPEYVRVLVRNEQGNFETLLLTEHELIRIRKRAATSPEETIEPTFTDKLRG